MWGAIVLVLLFLFVTGGISYYVGWHLTHPARKPITKTPAIYQLKYQSIHFPSRVDHLNLSGWLIPAGSAQSKKIVIEAHGYRENRSADKPALPVANALHKAGYAVLMFDFRDEGKSPGHEVSVGLYEQRDLLGAVDYAKKLGYRHIGIIGYSMGAVTALEVASRDQSVQAVVADSPFANFYQYLKINMPVWTHLPNWPFTSEILWEMPIFTHINPHLVDPEKDVRHFGQRPVMFIAGTADHLIPMSNSKTLYKELGTDKHASLWIVPGAKHVGAYTVEPKPYLTKVTQFFNDYL
ncbi:alpha/beta hydrolase [Alicyclobacillus sp. SO9]|nr:alpha/beta hydrolase [Alicyclobacillus sp. SO9]